MSYRKIKQLAAFAFALIAMVAYVFSYKQETDQLSVASLNQETVEIVLLDSQSDCVPFTIQLDQGLDLKGKLDQIIEAMKVQQTVVPQFKGFFPKETKLNSAELVDQTLKLDFNQKMDEFDPAIEMKLLEAMSYVFTQFEEVEQFEFTIDNEPVTRLTNGKITLNQPMDGSLTLNNFDTVNSTFHRSEGFVVAIEKKKEDFRYITLKCIRSNEPLINAVMSYYTRKDSILIDGNVKYKTFELTQSDHLLTLNISAEVLTPQKTCDPALLETILLTLKSNFDVDKIQVVVDGVVMMEVKPSEIKFNEI